jgi:hypothetical protein
MLTLRRLSLFAAAVALSPLLAPADEPSPADVQLKTIKYDALKEAVRAQKGKVVVVDFWGEF